MIGVEAANREKIMADRRKIEHERNRIRNEPKGIMIHWSKLSREEEPCDMEFKVPIVQDRMYEHKRWSIVHELIFLFEGKMWKAFYQVSATEGQDEDNWLDMDWKTGMVKCTQVKPVQVACTKYDEVK